MGGMDLESRIAALEAENEKLREALAESVMLAFETAIMADKNASGSGSDAKEATHHAVRRARAIHRLIGHDDVFGEFGA